MTLHTALQPISNTTLRNRVVTELKRLIVSGALEPGQRLTETWLANALGVSRGPLREAVRDLVDSGLLVSQPYKGLFVRSVTRRDLEEVYSLRTALEELAFRECWDRRTPAALSDLHRRHNALCHTVDAGADPALAIEQELDLHSWCYELSGHHLLQESWNRLKPNLQFYFIMHQKAHGRPGPLREAHDVYVALACGDDLDAMLLHLKSHMKQGFEETIRYVVDDLPGIGSPTID